jgi:hypothetical protein
MVALGRQKSTLQSQPSRGSFRFRTEGIATALRLLDSEQAGHALTHEPHPRKQEQQVFELHLAMAVEGDDLAVENRRLGSEFGRWLNTKAACESMLN